MGIRSKVYWGLANFCHACESRHPEFIDFIKQNRIRFWRKLFLLDSRFRRNDKV